ncbi:trypsin-like serine peptidase [Chenggangzhangella methanolivorans]|uniref:trypsin-like serine peptidase n=1 Tax=Chenggangzhangella methanolivorans TaxID=1437009 RepID=UPI0036078B6F
MSFRIMCAAAVLTLVAAPLAHAQSGETTSLKNRDGKSKVDYAKPLPLPTSPTAAAPLLDLLRQAEKSPIVEEAHAEDGQAGDGVRSLVKLPKSKVKAAADGAPPAPEFGTSGMVYNTAYEPNPERDPSRRAGKLFFKDNGDQFVCSASMVRRGVLVTAAHCVSQFGENRFFSNFKYVPAYSDGAAPFGEWDWHTVIAPTKYLKGTDRCAVRGIVCESDVAVIILAPQGSRYAGDATGYFGFAVGGFSYNNAGQAQITQLGYPVSLNGGEEMIRTDAQGVIDQSLANNTVMGSGQTGGSSGGPWLVNFGLGVTPDNTNPFGRDPQRNRVVGVTSWGYNDNGQMKQQGASFFTKKNITTLVKDACKKVKAACK